MCSIPVRCTLKFRLPGFWPSPVAMNVCRWTSAVISMSHANKSLCWAGTCTDNQPPCMYLNPLIVFLLWYCNRLQAHTHTRTHTGTPPHTPSFQVDWSLNLYTISYMKRQTNSLAMKDHGVSLSMRVSQSTKGEPNNHSNIVINFWC